MRCLDKWGNTMDEISYKEALILVKKYAKTSQNDRDTLRRQRLYSMVTYAREQSEVYREHYANLPVNFLLRDLPPISMDKLRGNEEKWLCRDIVENEISMAINSVRCFPEEKYLRAFTLKGSRAVIISANEDSAFLASWRKTTTVLSVFSPIEEIVAALNEIKPAYLWAYPSTLEKLIDCWELYKLNMHPVLIIAGGEPLSDELREKLTLTFDCKVCNSYSSREAGVIAYECSEGHLHVNDDWVIVEPIDAGGRIVPDGILSDKVLLTNLYKTDRPAIRMMVNDHVIMHSEGCACGNPSPWLTVQAGVDEYISFNSPGGEIKIAFTDFNEVFEGTKGLLGYQLVFYAGNNISVRLDVKEGVSKSLVFLKLESKLRGFFRSLGLTMGAITIDEDGTLLDKDNGKFKNVLDLR